MNSNMDLFGRLQTLFDEFVANGGKTSKHEILLRSVADELKQEMQQTALEAMQKLEKSINQLSSQQLESREKVLSDINDVHQSVLVLSQTVTQLVKQVELLNQNMQKEETSPPVESSIVEAEYPQKRYAGIIDSDSPLGFRNDNIKTEMTSCVFQLTLSDAANGTYQFVDDADIQKQILSAFDPVVTASSDYDNAYGAISKIKVVSPGVIKLENGIWRIITKQKVEFE